MVFGDVIGQPQVTETLKKQVSSGRLSHAYLFTGTRGTGKTTCAKILSKAVNCLAPKDGEPCNECESCAGINSGSITDVIEIDAASNSGVDNIRTIRDQTAYSPAETKLRVYIIDECHMLSQGAFNALLKTLEEPPPHVLFILATTELHKVPATILSRCQRFSFRRIEAEDIAPRLLEISEKEGIAIDAKAAELISRFADGGLRDAISILDQCAASANGSIDASVVLDLLGLAGTSPVMRVVDAVLSSDCETALSLLGELYAGGVEVAAFLSEMSSAIRDILIYNVTNNINLLSPGFDADATKRLKISKPRMLDMLSVIQDTLAKLQRSQNKKLDTELCLIRLSDESLSQDISGILSRIDRLESGGFAVRTAEQNAPAAPAGVPPEKKNRSAAAEDTPPWDMDEAEAKHTPRNTNGAEAKNPTRDTEAPASSQGVEKKSASPAEKADPGFWQPLLREIRSGISMSHYSHLASQKTPVLEGNRMRILCESDFALKLLNRPEVISVINGKATEYFKRDISVDFTPAGEYRPSSDAGSSQEHSAAKEKEDNFSKLLEIGEKFSDITEKS
jgi:DNA polymerase-3 subunit gamma/tau